MEKTSAHDWKQPVSYAGSSLLGAAAGALVASRLDRQQRNVLVSGLLIAGAFSVLPRLIGCGIELLNKPTRTRVQRKTIAQIRGDKLNKYKADLPPLDDDELYGV